MSARLNSNPLLAGLSGIARRDDGRVRAAWPVDKSRLRPPRKIFSRDKN